MKAAKLSSFFEKKIAKTMTYPITLASQYRNGEDQDAIFIVEPMALEDNVLRAIVTRKGTKANYLNDAVSDRYCGEAVIPILDGDSFESIMEMAIAEAAYGEKSLTLRSPQNGDNRLAVAYRALASRLAEQPTLRPPGF